jgi:energy-coupling factor transporter ATP-binding protein EcfA2
MSKDLVFDHVNEQLVLVAGLHGGQHRRDLVRKLRPDVFQIEENRALWTAVRAMASDDLAFEPETLARYVPEELVLYAIDLVKEFPKPSANLRAHLDALLWDKQRFDLATTVLPDLIDAIKDGDADRGVVRSLAKRLTEGLAGAGTGRYLRRPGMTADEQLTAIKARRNGTPCYPYGLAGLDRDPDGHPILVPGAAPGTVLVVTGVSGAGKSTLVARLVVGLIRQHRKVCFGAWEMQSGPMLELLASIHAGVSRRDLAIGKVTDDTLKRVEESMAFVEQYVRFLDNPFVHPYQEDAKRKRSTLDNINELGGYIADSGCSIFVGDLLRRGFTALDPEEEELALYAFQALMSELQVHGIAVQQQRLKDIELRGDKRPTRDGIKGSAAWVEIADTILGAHRPALFKSIPDETFEVCILKQRFGRWPVALEFQWDPDTVEFRDGHEVPYDLGDTRDDDGKIKFGKGRGKKFVRNENR